MLALTLWSKNRNGRMDTNTFLCDSFEQDYRDGSFKIHFTNGEMRIDSDAFDGFIVYRHSFGESDILYPLNPTRMEQRSYDDGIEEDEVPSIEDLEDWLYDLAEELEQDGD